MKKTFVVWNPSKVSAHGGAGLLLDPDTLAGLNEAERNTDSSISSYVITDDIESIIRLAENECDVTLKYAEVETVAIFSLGDYSDYNDALSSRAITYIENVEPSELAIIKLTFEMTSKSIGCSDRVIGTVKDGEFTPL